MLRRHRKREKTFFRPFPNTRGQNKITHVKNRWPPVQLLWVQHPSPLIWNGFESLLVGLAKYINHLHLLLKNIYHCNRQYNFKLSKCWNMEIFCLIFILTREVCIKVKLTNYPNLNMIDFVTKIFHIMHSSNNSNWYLDFFTWNSEFIYFCPQYHILMIFFYVWEPTLP